MITNIFDWQGQGPSLPTPSVTTIDSCDTPREPLLPLDTLRKLLGWNPWHFWGLADTVLVPVTSSCSTFLAEYAWQDTDKVGRSDIREAILAAEDLLLKHLGYAPAPHYTCDTLPYPRHYDVDLWRAGSSDAGGRWSAVKLREGMIRAVGVESLTLVGSVGRTIPAAPGDALVFTDSDGDGLYETFTATIATTATDPDKIALYFQAADRLDGAGVGERWRIQPISVSISGGTATIKGKTWLLVRPLNYEGVDADAPLDPTVLTANNPFVDALDVYIRTTDPDGNTVDTSQAELIWGTKPWPEWAMCCLDTPATSNATDPAAEAYAIARAGILDSRAGLVIPGAAVYNATTAVWSAQSWGTCRPPDRVTVRYLAGQELRDGAMDPRFARAVTRLAVAELARPLCGCESANREVYRWQFDLARSAGNNDEAYLTSATDLDNPFGTRRGHLDAWRTVRSLRIARGLTAG